ncbi:hypothetical protein IAT38_003173 [Cryptococcus sp. DSM 104549]
MGNRKITKKAIKGKEGLHPGSRKAAQLTRVHLRTTKLAQESRIRKTQASSKLTRPLFFLHSLSSQHPLSLESFRALISEVYIKRHDPRIDELVEERRPGRPKPKELLELEELRSRERTEYETGMEVPDLTHAPNTRLMWSWIENDTSMSHAHLDLLRHVRIGPKMEPLVTKPGNTEKMGLAAGIEEGVLGEDWTSLVDKETMVE